MSRPFKCDRCYTSHRRMEKCPETKEVFIIVKGNICEGFKFIGPFDSFDDASDYDYYKAGANVGDSGWIAGMLVPNKD